MNRRYFIKVTGLGIGSVVLSSGIVGCMDPIAGDEYGWNGPDKLETDIRMQVLAYAILSPNPHNKQPWIVRLTGPMRFDLYVDSERLLPETDPLHRQIHIGQGTFLETLSIAATGLGYQAVIDYFPQGIYNNSELADKPVASIKLVKNEGTKIDPLFHSILTRHSNKREYNDYQLDKTEIATLQKTHASYSEYPLTFQDSPTAKELLVKTLTQAMQLEVGNKQRDMETIQMFRFNDEEVRQHRDGFGVAQAGLSGVTKFIAETFFLDREKVETDPTEFGQQAVDMTQKVGQSTNTFGWISTHSNTRLDQVKVGRDYCRLNLQTTMMGLAQHPMSQVLQEYDDMLALQQSFKKSFNIPADETVQMLFRLGKAEPVVHGPRRLVKQLIRV
jgi:hypothetical protein